MLEDKLGILDIRIFIFDKVEGNKDTPNETAQIDLEIQISPFPLWPERSVFYLSKLYTGQIHKGQSYDVLQKCIHVGILDFVLFEEDEEFYSRFHIWEDSRRWMYTDKLEIHILELPKLAGKRYPETELLNWARFFNAEQKEEFEMAAGTSPYVEKAYERLTELSADEEKRLEYEAREKAIRDHNFLMTTNLEMGRKKGLEEGRKKGLEEGRKAGMEEGKKEGKKEGKEEGLEQGARAFIGVCQEASYSREKAYAGLIQNLSLTPEKADQYLNQYWKGE